MRIPNHSQQAVTALWIAVILLSAILGVLLAKSAAAHIHDHPEWDQWLNEQKVPDGRNYGSRSDYCCDKSDAYVVDEDTELRQGENGDPEVRIDGTWYRFPNRGVGNPGNTVIGESDNPTNHMIAWLLHGNPRCLAAGSGT